MLGHRMVYNWPDVAFAELLTNAVLHKEYDRKQYVGVYVYRDTLSFINHNRPLPPVTIDDLNSETEFRDRNYLNPEVKEMFHALGLIESYGSGVRRAKRAMADNGNSPPLFEPLNDTDDYTMVTCPISEEFACIRDHEDEVSSMPSGKGAVNAQETDHDAQETDPDAQETGGNAQEIDARILRELQNAPTLNAKNLADMLDEPYDAIRYWLRKLREEHRIHHEGPREPFQQYHWLCHPRSFLQK